VLVSLSIRNFVLIEDAVLEFEPGLNVLTGETGAGKTLLTRALGLLMGERAEDGLVGQAGPDASIQAVFDLSDADVADMPEQVKDLVGDVAAGELIVTRKLGREGRNRCYVNDTAVTLSALGGAVGGLLSFAGQHEYRRLLDPAYQLSVLDQWAGAEVTRLAEDYRQAFDAARQATRRLAESRRNEEARSREMDLLRFEVRELREAQLSLEEEESLDAEQRLLARAEDVLRSTALAAAELRGDGDSTADNPDAATLVSQAVAQLSALQGVDAALDRLHGTLTELHYQIVDAARELNGYSDRVSIDPERLEAVNARLRLYTDLGRKYGGSTQAAVTRLLEATERLESLEFAEDDCVRLEEARAAQAARALDLAGQLEERRRKAAPLLEQAVAGQLADLGMPSAALTIDIRSRHEWEGLRESGGDEVEFLLVANPGQEPRSLARTASGGELSRVLLGIKCALAGAGGNETLVFDEIDAGIGGRTAVAVANKLRELGESSQVVVITHLAQVAALARRHYLIDKVSDAAGAVTRLTRLTDEPIVAELCRMLGGRAGDAEAMAHARQLRDSAAGGLLD
jgi:DNA repair protein RecN (Recombination protein N)